MFFFAPATPPQSYAYPSVSPSNQGCPASSEWIFPMNVSQGFIIPPDQFQQAYSQSKNTTDWWSMFYFCATNPLQSEFVLCLLGRYNYSVIVDLYANRTSIPSNSTICMPDWSVLDSTSTLVTITLSTSWRNVFTLPSTQNPYNPFCVEINAEVYFSIHGRLGITTTFVYLPIELQKPVPLTFEFNYNWQTTPLN